MFITPAFADTTATAAAAATDVAPSGFASLTQFLPFILIMIVMYVMVIRPQSQRAQEHRAMIQGLQKGDRVITGGGFIATVKKVVSDEEVVLEIADGVQVHALRSTIMSKKDKGTKDASV
jgi:preprotein translocase subunit YajC